MSFTVYSQEVGVVYVDTTKVVEQIPQTQLIKENLKKEFSAKDHELILKQQVITDLEEKLVAEASSMRDVEKRKIEREILIRQRDFKAERNEFVELVKTRREEETQTLKQTIKDVIYSLAIENGYSMVMESNVIYASPEIDVTEQIISRMVETFEQENEITQDSAENVIMDITEEVTE